MSVAVPSLVAPAFRSVPEHRTTGGAEAADLAALSGFVPDDEQRMILDAFYAEKVPGSTFQSGQWAALEQATIAARQNIKTSTMLMACSADAFLFDARLIVWTAHLFQTAAEAFLDFKNLIDGNAHLSRKVRRITEAAGNQGVELMNGCRVKFIARSKASGRGMSGDVVFFDEAYALSAAELGALIPTLSARPNPAVRYGSSAGRLESEVLRMIRDRGRAGDPSLAYLEWCSTAACLADGCDHALDTPGCVLDDPDEWQKANPAMGRRIDPDYIAKERRALTPAEFARERLGWWDEPKGGTVIPFTRWAPLGAESVIDGDAPLAVAVDVALDRSAAWVGLCGRNEAGVPQVEIAATQPGTDWVSDYLDGLLSRRNIVAVGARSAGPVASLLPELAGVCEVSEVPFVKIGSGDMAGMCGQFYDAVAAANLAHRTDPRIDTALAAARKHRVVDAWSWERERVDVDAAPLVAITGAFGLFNRFRAEPYDPLANIF